MQRRHQVGLQTVDPRLIARRVNSKKHLTLFDALIRFVGDAVNHSGNLRRNRNRYHRLLRQKGVRVVIVH